jgi:hypothetical protein
MPRNLFTEKLNLVCDIMEETFEQDAVSGALKRTWTVTQSDVPCFLTAQIGSGVGATGIVDKTVGGKYITVEIVKAVFGPDIEISTQGRITNIRDWHNNVIWAEYTGTPTTFSVDGVVPIVSPFGKKVESVVMLRRSEVQ